MRRRHVAPSVACGVGSGEAPSSERPVLHPRDRSRDPAIAACYPCGHRRMHKSMTQSSADKVATVVVGVVAAGAAYYVLRTPRLRRAVWRLGVAALTGTIPAWVSQEIKASWEASGQRSAATNV